jgi:hypothetical protein
MTAQQIVGLAVRLFAIWLLLSAVQAIDFGVSLNRTAGAEPTWAPFAFASAFVVFAILLWLFPMTVAHRLIPRTKFENVLHIPGQEVVVVACIVFALWIFCVRVLPGLGYFISLVSFLIKNNQSTSSLNETQFVRLVPTLVDLAVAIFLALRAKTISAFLLADRTKGQCDE